jgi:hypothetical protein
MMTLKKERIDPLIWCLRTPELWDRRWRRFPTIEFVQ